MFIVILQIFIFLHYFNNSHAMVMVEPKQQSASARTDRQIRPIVDGLLFLLFANLAVKGVLGLNALNTPQSPANINGSLFFSFGNQAAPPPTVSQQQIQPQQFASYQPVLVLNRENTPTTHKPTITRGHTDYEFLRRIQVNSQSGALQHTPNGFYNKMPKYNMDKSPKVLDNPEGETQILSNYLPKSKKQSQNDQILSNSYNHLDFNNILSNALQSRRRKDDNFDTKIEIASNNIINYLPPTRNQFFYRVPPNKPVDYLTPVPLNLDNDKTRLEPKLSTNLYGKDEQTKSTDPQMNIIKLTNVIDLQKYLNNMSSNKKTVSMLLNRKEVKPKRNNNDISFKEVQELLPNSLNCRYTTGDTIKSINRLRRHVKTSQQLDVDNNLIRRGKQLDDTSNVTMLPTGLESFTTEPEQDPDDDEFGRQQVNTTTTPTTTTPTTTTNATDNTTTDDPGYGPPNGNDNINITYPDINNTVYGPPNNTYGPPNNLYGPPTNVYGPPIVNNVYGPPAFSKPISPGFYPSSSGFYPSFNDKNPFGTYFQKPYGFENKYPSYYSPNTFSSFYNQFPSSTKYAFGSGYGYGKPASTYPFNFFRK